MIWQDLNSRVEIAGSEIGFDIAESVIAGSVIGFDIAVSVIAGLLLQGGVIGLI